MLVGSYLFSSMIKHDYRNIGIPLHFTYPGMSFHYFYNDSKCMYLCPFLCMCYVLCMPVGIILVILDPRVHFWCFSMMVNTKVFKLCFRLNTHLVNMSEVTSATAVLFCIQIGQRVCYLTTFSTNL